MQGKGHWTGMATDAEFSLWRILDHTRFMIARSREKELSKCGLTPEQSFVLDILMESNGSTTINELVAITQRQHHSISTLIDRMNRQGLILKQKGAGDKRQYEVEITSKGRDLAQKMSRASINSIFASLSEEERDELRSSLRKLMRVAYGVLNLDPAPAFLNGGDKMPAGTGTAEQS
jgi:DNA-binding MarR family transcriptional regulator